MDSITQITLGAAVGEAVLGRKVGNRAMLWGGIIGTIPDLDVLSDFVLSEIDALAFHRAITHSITFSIFGAIVFGFLIHRYYLFRYRRPVSFICWMVPVFLLVYLLNFTGSKEINVFWFGASLLLLLLTFLWNYKKYYLNTRRAPGVSSLDWMHLSFWTLITHPLLDSCTVYGTQLFLPFSNYRVAFNNISVADPAYTIPFLLLVLVASFLHKSNNKRRIFNYAALVISSLYMLWTVSNKFQANTVMERTLESKNIEYKRYMTSPTILNNWLWYSIAESDSLFHYGLYSFSDEEKLFKLHSMPKNHHWLNAHPDDKTINTLKWFSNGYFGVMRKKDGGLQINDMRYGTFSGNEGAEDDFIFRFEIEKKEDGYYHLIEAFGGPPEGQDQSQAFRDLFSRMEGI
jgi:inner membrane protein